MFASIRGIFSGIPCGGCNGTGTVPGDKSQPSSPAEGSKAPRPLAELLGDYDEAVSRARSKQKELRELIDRLRFITPRPFEWEFYWRLWKWARNLDPEAPGTKEELVKMEADLNGLGMNAIAVVVRGLANVCDTIDTYRFLIESRRGSTAR